MTNQVIPDDAVEAAAIGIASANLTSRKWEDLSEEVRGHFRDDARAALEAAAPHMLAEAWDEGSIAGWVESGLPHSWHAENSLRNANPYRTAK